MKVVDCEVCGTEIKLTPSRYRRNKHHTCSKKCLGLLSSKKYSEKVVTNCVICHKEVKYKKSHFKKIKNHTCSRECSAKWKHENYSGYGNPKFANGTELERYFSNKLTGCSSRSKSSGWEFNLDVPYMVGLYESQKGLCHYTKMPMKLGGARNFDTLSIDRIDSSKGYIQDNVVLCALSVNMMKSNYSYEGFKKCFKAVQSSGFFVGEGHVKRLYEDAKLPLKQDFLDAGYDLFTHRVEDCGNFIKIYTGVAVQPEFGLYFMLAPRSSTCKRGLIMYNSVGIIDQNYQGEIMAIFYKSKDFKELPKVGDRLVQLIPQKQINIGFIEVDEFSEDSDRGQGGFGSSGK